MPRARITEKSIPAFPNVFPYNELLLRGSLMAKTRSWEWEYRGPVLLYTSSRTENYMVRTHGIDPNCFGRKVLVGIGWLKEVRALNRSEALKLLRQFNNKPDNWRPRRDGGIIMNLDDRAVEPLPIGYFFQNLHRFQNEVGFNWPCGPVKPINVPVSVVQQQLDCLNIHL